MSNQFYTPTETYNPTFVPEPGIAQRMLDTKNKIDDKKKVDDLYQQKFEQGRIETEKAAQDLQVGKLKMDEALTSKRLEVLGQQAYNAAKAAGLSDAECIRAGDNARAADPQGGWIIRQQDREHKLADLDKIYKMDVLTPGALRMAVTLENSMREPGSILATEADISARWSASKGKLLSNGEYITTAADGSTTVKQLLSPEAKEENRVKAEQEAAKIKSDEAWRAQQIASSKAGDIQDAARTGIDRERLRMQANPTSKEDEIQYKEVGKTVSVLERTVKSLTHAIDTYNPSTSNDKFNQAFGIKAGSVDVKGQLKSRLAETLAMLERARELQSQLGKRGQIAANNANYIYNGTPVPQEDASGSPFQRVVSKKNSNGTTETIPVMQLSPTFAPRTAEEEAAEVKQGSDTLKPLFTPRLKNLNLLNQ